MRIEYDKLIRDKIPEIIEEAGKNYGIEVMGEDDYRRALLEKLGEEADEALHCDVQDLETEMADLLEVLDAIVEEFNLSYEEIVKIKDKRRNKRGGFRKRLKLLYTEPRQL